MKELYNIKNRIYNMKSRNEILKESIINKLDKSYYNYNDAIDDLCSSLLESNSSTVLKNIVKSQSKEMKENESN